MEKIIKNIKDINIKDNPVLEFISTECVYNDDLFGYWKSLFGEDDFVEKIITPLKDSLSINYTTYIGGKETLDEYLIDVHKDNVEIEIHKYYNNGINNNRSQESSLIYNLTPTSININCEEGTSYKKIDIDLSKKLNLTYISNFRLYEDRIDGKFLEKSIPDSSNEELEDLFFGNILGTLIDYELENTNRLGIGKIITLPSSLQSYRQCLSETYGFNSLRDKMIDISYVRITNWIKASPLTDKYYELVIKVDFLNSDEIVICGGVWKDLLISSINLEVTLLKKGIKQIKKEYKTFYNNVNWVESYFFDNYPFTCDLGKTIANIIQNVMDIDYIKNKNDVIDYIRIEKITKIEKEP